MKQQFLPEAQVTTIIWADEDRDEVSKWFAAQGDDLKNQRATIEINLPRIIKVKGDKPQEVALQMIDSWLAIYIVLATRQDLIDKQVRGWLSAEAETELQAANFKVIKASPILWSFYCEKAVNHLKESQSYKTEKYRKLLDGCLKAMDDILMEARPFICV
ncbi:unnamed protein product [marine sediment metagenome]|uniref:Uncharacterized protein n=1 Tax=marine sediment metagenome TaxID=412755 RepID=X1J5B0_9ZZZZ